MIEAALSFVGAGIAGTLWWAERTQRDVPCSADGGCDIVNHSAWSHVDLLLFSQVPIALLGMLGYLALLSLSMLRLGTESERWSRIFHRGVWLIAAGGTAYSWYLQWVAHVRIGAFCIWCRSSAIVMTALLLLATLEWWLEGRLGRRQMERRPGENA